MVTITNSKPTKSGTLPNIINEKNYMNYKVMLAKILSEKELADMDIKNIKEDDTLLEELIRKEYALVVDWSGEEGDNYLFNFFNQRTISLLGKQLDISSNEVYQQFDKDIDTPKRGDFVPFALVFITIEQPKLIRNIRV